MTKLLATVLAFGTLFFGTAASAADDLGYKIYTTNAKYEDVRDDLKDAIINKGFVIDYVGYVHDMLERTAEATDSVTPLGAKSPYKNAEYVLFCPAKLTHEAVSATPFAIANCPIAIFVFETGAEPGKINVGYRLPPTTPSRVLRQVNERITALVDSIVKDAVGK